MDENTKDILETVNFIKEHMLTKEEGATKDDVRDIIRKEVPQIVREETKDIRAELTSIRRDLEALTDKVDNIVGLPKEIDHALERIAARKTPRHQQEDRGLAVIRPAQNGRSCGFEH